MAMNRTYNIKKQRACSYLNVIALANNARNDIRHANMHKRERERDQLLAT